MNYVLVSTNNKWKKFIRKQTQISLIHHELKKISKIKKKIVSLRTEDKTKMIRNQMQNSNKIKKKHI